MNYQEEYYRQQYIKERIKELIIEKLLGSGADPRYKKNELEKQEIQKKIDSVKKIDSRIEYQYFIESQFDKEERDSLEIKICSLEYGVFRAYLESLSREIRDFSYHGYNSYSYSSSIHHTSALTYFKSEARMRTDPNIREEWLIDQAIILSFTIQRINSNLKKIFRVDLDEFQYIKKRQRTNLENSICDMNRIRKLGMWNENLFRYERLLTKIIEFLIIELNIDFISIVKKSRHLFVLETRSSGIDFYEKIKDRALSTKKPSSDFEYNIISQRNGTISKYNKPDLKQSQISALFMLLRDNKAFVRGLDNTKISMTANYLTGYSKNTIRASLSEENISSIIDKEEDLDNLIYFLERITEKAKLEKKNYKI